MINVSAIQLHPAPPEFYPLLARCTHRNLSTSLLSAATSYFAKITSFTEKIK